MHPYLESNMLKSFERIANGLHALAASAVTSTETAAKNLLSADERNNLNELLAYAICENNVGDVSNLIKAGASVHARCPNHYHATFFALACKYYSGDMQIIEKLYKEGAVIGDARPFADTCIEVVEENSNTTKAKKKELVKFLESRGIRKRKRAK